MNKKAIIFLGSIFVLILVTIGFIVFVQIRNKNSSSSATTTSQNTQTSQNNQNQNQNQNTQPTPTPQPTPAPTPTPTPTPPPAAQTGKTLKVTDTQAVSPALSPDGTLLWYFTPDGHLFDINVKTGDKQEYLLPTNYPVARAIWPSIGNDFIIQSGTGSAKTFHYYNNQTKTFVNYPTNVKEVDFMPDGLHVAYEWVDSKGAATLSTANADLTGHKTIATMPDPDDVIKVAPSRNRAFYYKADSLADGKLYYVNLDTGKGFIIKTAATNMVTWAPDGNRFLYNRLDKDGNAQSHTLWIGDLDKNTDVTLGVDTTPDKAVFDKAGANVVLGVPESSLDGSDALLIADTSSFQGNKFFTEKGISAVDLNVANDDSAVYFKNSDGFVYRVGIK